MGSDSDLMARAVIHSGSYGHFTQVTSQHCTALLPCPQHTARPADDGLLLAQHQLCPNFSLRMTNLAAVLVLDQLETVEDKIASFNLHYNILQTRLGMFCSDNSVGKYKQVHMGQFKSCASLKLNLEFVLCLV